MKKLFEVCEIVRKKDTMIYGAVACVLSETEYYVTFDGITEKYTIDELSYGVFKQLFEFYKYYDQLGDIKLIELIKTSKWYQRIKKAVHVLLFSTACYFVGMLLSIIF